MKIIILIAVLFLVPIIARELPVACLFVLNLCSVITHHHMKQGWLKQGRMVLLSCPTSDWNSISFLGEEAHWRLLH